MQAMNQLDGILHRKIRSTARSCHRPQSPTLRPITSLEFIVIMEGTSISSTIDFLRWLLRDTTEAERSFGKGTKSSMVWIPPLDPSLPPPLPPAPPPPPPPLPSNKGDWTCRKHKRGQLISLMEYSAVLQLLSLLYARNTKRN